MRFDINCSRFFKNKALLYKNQKPEAYDLSELHISDGEKNAVFSNTAHLKYTYFILCLKSMYWTL